MPWLVRKEGDQFCVFKEGADGQPTGGSLGCHPTEEAANGQRRALYANVEKSLPGFTLWKEASGLYRWFAIYSNNFRDDDHPSEIISHKSQKTFVEMVDKGIVDFPELWIWHVPVPWGKADWVDYAEGFALASGTVFPEYNWLAENLAKEKNLATSHGMPKLLLQYDPLDKSVITFHITKEISPLPRHRAANRRTGFVIFEGDEQMPLDPEKRAWLINNAGFKESFVQSIEKQLDEAASKAQGEGIESKEASPAAEAAPVAETPAVVATEPVPATEPAATPVTEDAKSKEAEYATREEVASVLSELLTPLIQGQAALATQMAALTKELTEVKKADQEKITALKEATPPLSFRDMVAKNLLGSAAKMKEGDPLHEDKPTEAAPAAQFTPTIVPFVNGLVQSAAGK